MNNATTLSTSTPPLPESWVEKLFSRMLLDYGKKFTDQWGGADTGDLIAHWAREMGGYTGPEIRRGLAALETREWPPTLPEFKKLCRPPVDASAVYYEALAGLEARGKGQMGEWSHRGVYWAAEFMKKDLTTQTYAQVKDRWAGVLAAQMQRTEWAEIPMPRVALPAPGDARMSREAAAKGLAALGASGVLDDTGRDPLRWAKKILERVARGDKTVSAFIEREARMGLNMPAEVTA